MREAQSKEAKRSRYEEDPGEDTFYDGAAARKTIAETTRTTCVRLPRARARIRGATHAHHSPLSRRPTRARRLQTYHSALNSKSLQTLPLTNSFTPGPKYDGNRTLLSGRRHGAPSETKTVSLAPVHVHNAKKPTPSFDASLERFQVGRASDATSGQARAAPHWPPLQTPRSPRLLTRRTRTRTGAQPKSRSATTSC